MSVPFVQAIDAEIAQLKAELANDPRLIKIKELQRIRTLYVGDQNQVLTEGLSYTSVPPIPKGNGRHRSPQRQQILGAAEEFLREQPKPLGALPPPPTPTSRIAAHIEASGLIIPGQNKRNSLSAMLSNSPRFRSHGRAGWTLASEETYLAEDTEAADHYLEGVDSAASAEPRQTSEGTEPVRPVNPWPGGGI